VQTLSISDTSTVLVGLTNNENYTVRVAAITEFGIGAWTAPLTVMPRATRVSTPRDVKAKRVGAKVTVTWRSPGAGTPKRYVVTASVDGKAYRSVSTSKTTSSTFKVPVSARSVRIQVVAIDRYGVGPESAPITPRRRS
jgi:hypothetical protein